MKRLRMINTIMSVLAALGVCAPTRLGRTLPDAWEAWADGDISTAHARASEQLAAGQSPDAAHHMLFLCEFVSGKYRAALDRLDRISADYPDRDALAELALDAYVHLDRFDEALAFVRSAESLPDTHRELAARHAARPLAVELAGVTVAPFASHDLMEYFPGFDTEINGAKLIAHMDTGGSFLIMGPDRAKALGIETIAGEMSAAHLDMTKMRLSHGIADRFVLGDAVLRNVPVTVLPTLTGDNDWVIFGTCILERFLATLDYPGRRLILSSRNNDAARAEHLALLPKSDTRVPFLLWSDHFMFARGSLGSNTDLNFFVDSGLVLIQPGKDGQPHQAAFTTSSKKLRALGVDSDVVKREFFESPFPIRLGPLEQAGHYIVTGAVGDGEFGGIRVDGLLSHAFLKRYVWTMDFDAMEYRFGEPR